MKDIETREDIVLLLHAFYEKVFLDDLIAHFFTKVINVDIKQHIPRIADFWETVLLNANSYKANAIAPHQHINQLSPMEEKHFTRWLQLFGETIDSLYAGNIAENAKQRASSVATVMRIKINNSPGINIIK